MSLMGELIEEEILLGGMGGRRRRNDIVSDVFQAEALMDLAQGDVGGFVEDEILADIL